VQNAARSWLHLDKVCHRATASTLKGDGNPKQTKVMARKPQKCDSSRKKQLGEDPRRNQMVAVRHRSSISLQRAHRGYAKVTRCRASMRCVRAQAGAATHAQAPPLLDSAPPAFESVGSKSRPVTCVLSPSRSNVHAEPVFLSRSLGADDCSTAASTPRECAPPWSKPHAPSCCSLAARGRGSGRGRGRRRRRRSDSGRYASRVCQVLPSFPMGVHLSRGVRVISLLKWSDSVRQFTPRLLTFG
jgi:hypothetical protein